MDRPYGVPCAPRLPRTARALGGAVAALVVVLGLAACGGVPGVPGFSVDVPGSVALTAGDPTGTNVDVTITFDAAYAERVRLSANTATAGLHVLRADDGRQLAQAPVELSASGTVGLTIVADAGAQTTNAYVVLSAIGVDANGRDAGLPRYDPKVVFSFTP